MRPIYRNILFIEYTLNGEQLLLLQGLYKKNIAMCSRILKCGSLILKYVINRELVVSFPRTMFNPILISSQMYVINAIIDVS